MKIYLNTNIYKRYIIFYNSKISRNSVSENFVKLEFSKLLFKIASITACLSF